MPLTSNLPVQASALAALIHACLVNPDRTGRMLELYDLKALSPAAIDLVLDHGERVSTAERLAAAPRTSTDFDRAAARALRDLEVLVEALAVARTAAPAITVGA